ncbi:MAG TPA: serine/threonine-protein kinase [Bryobacteraceae bacterium]|nr:serine/threonine-protein kinase [Bryobacteraceae bacterium]
MQDEVPLLFREVADLAPAERERYFERHAVPAELRAELESLLSFDAPDTPLAQLIAGEAEAVLGSDESPPEGLRCGPYRLTRLLGRGGTGEVFLGERIDGQIEQRVAIKLIQQNLTRRSFRSRFLQERQILASLQHPGIARLLDAGETQEGRPYLVLDYIDGEPIDAYSRKLDLRGKLGLFLKVCDAVGYAHRNLIVHRDLKPSNILVNAEGEPKLLDFGISKILEDGTDRTRTQERLLTPDYASPEQVRGTAQTTATDVYSLGAVLYHLLTGQSPHTFPSRTPEGIDAAICFAQPAAASRLNPALPQDLDFILLKALRKEPEERYSSVEALAGDIRAFLEWRPIRARSGNTWYRARKFVRRYRTAVAAAALTIAGLATGLFVANRQRLIAEERFQQLHLLSGKVFDLDDRIRGLPGATEARQELVAMSLAYLEGLGGSAHGDLDLAQEIGAAYMRVASIQGVPTSLNLGETDEAEENLAKADRFIDLVLESRKTSAAALVLSAGIARDRMIVASTQGRKADAAAHAAKAVERLDRLFGLGKLTPDQRDSAASYYANIALNYVNLHRYEEGVKYARKSMEAAASLPSEPRIRAVSLSLIGSSLRSQGRLDEALTALREARQIAEGSVFSSPVDRAFNLYGILLREARTLGQDGGVSLGRTEEAIAVYREAVNLMEEQASKDPRDQNARDRLALCSRELADLLEERDPQGSLAVFELGIQRLREVKNNVGARRNEAEALAESSYPLRRLHRLPESRQRIDAAFALLRETKDYPAEQIDPESQAVAALRARADYESQVGDRRRAVEIYESLFDAMMASKPDPLRDLMDATKVSMMWYYMAGVYRRAGDGGKAAGMDQRRLELWRQWDGKLPHNGFVQRQLAMRSE